MFFPRRICGDFKEHDKIEIEKYQDQRKKGDYKGQESVAFIK